MERSMELQNYKPISNLQNSIGMQHKISATNADDLCQWIYRWGWTTAQIINRFLDLKRQGLADEFVKKGLLEKLKSEHARGEKFVYILSEEGVRRAEELLDQNYGYVKTYPYTLHESRKIPYSLHVHNMVSQHVLLDMAGPRANTLNYITEPEYRAEGGGGIGDSVPDFSFTERNGDRGDTTFICEIELNHKEDMRMKRWIWLRLLDLKADPSAKLIFFTNLNSVRDSIEKILAQERIFGFEKNQNNRWVETPNSSLLIQKYIERIEIKTLFKDDSRKTGGLIYENKLNTSDPEVLGWDD